MYEVIKKHKKKFGFGLAVLLLFFALNELLIWTVYNPSVAVRAYRWLSTTGLIRFTPLAVEKSDYPVISISELERDLFWGPRAAVVGTVSDEQKILDGDWHINIRDDSGHVLVTEMIPEYTLPLPTVGEKIKIWGITRYDLEHRWWELHPIIGWEAVQHN